ncbi:hypothetical protein AgCh_021794 [Apium graveolens]
MGFPQHSVLTENGNAVLPKYNSWQVKHPSALDKFEHMMSMAKGRNIVVLLDYDGTLSDIVPNPEEAYMTNKMRVAVRQVAACFPTAIISGRSRHKVYDFVRLDNLYYAGSHGLDIAAPLQCLKYGVPKHQSKVLDIKGKEVVLFQPAESYIPEIQKIHTALDEKTKNINGRGILWSNAMDASNNSIADDVKMQDFMMLEEQVMSVVHDNRDFRLSMGKMVFEIRPDIEWDKGHAVEYLLKTIGGNTSTDVLPIYIGDDRTDEDAFKAISSREQGYSIVVSSTPKETMASYSLRDPREVNKFLQRLVGWKRVA